MKVMYNGSWGGFDIPKQARDLYLERTGRKWSPYDDNRSFNELRADVDMIAIVEELGDEVFNENYPVAIAEFPDEATDFLITDYDGWESVYYVLNGKIY